VSGPGFSRAAQQQQKTGGLYTLPKNSTRDVLCNKGTASAEPKGPQNKRRAFQAVEKLHSCHAL
jgi:hypothetical protein